MTALKTSGDDALTTVNLQARVLTVTPTGRDAKLTCQALQRADINAVPCESIERLCAELTLGAGVLLVAEEALADSSLTALIEILKTQPPWSDIPVLIFSSEKSNQLLVTKLSVNANITILERPLRIATLISAVRAALRARLRQYEVRDLLERLQEANRQKDMFLAMLGHELRNPLSAVSNAIHSLDQISSNTPDAVQLRNIITRQVRHVSHLIDDLLDVSRITSGKISLQRVQADLNEIAEKSLQAMQAARNGVQHTLKFLPAKEPLPVIGDPVRLEQVISNLLSNAMKYTPDGGVITLALAREDGSAVVRVKDNGIGISPEMLSSIFDLFTQVETSLDRAKGGLGLGLTLSRNLIEQHNGTLAAISDGPGRGSEFIIRLPLDVLPDTLAAAPAPAAIALPAAATEKVDRSSRQILIVEDNIDSRESLELMLKLEGHQVSVAGDGIEGVKLALTARPEIALVDIGLPGLNGYEVAERLRAEAAGREIFLIALTGYGQPEDIRRAKAAGFNAHLIKPPEPDELFKLINDPSIGSIS